MIENGGTTIGNTGQIVDADGEASSPTISVEAEGDGQADDQGPWADPSGCAIIDLLPMGFPLPLHFPVQQFLF